jgi:hypothetical protein
MPKVYLKVANLLTKDFNVQYALRIRLNKRTTIHVYKYCTNKNIDTFVIKSISANSLDIIEPPVIFYF